MISVAAGAAPSRCVERPTSTLLRATNTTLNVTTENLVNTDMSTVPREGNTVPRRSSKEHAEHSRKSVHLWSATSKTRRAQVTCRHPASRTVEPRSCGNKCSVHVPTRTSNEKSQVLWPIIPGEVAQKTRLCGSISQVEDLHSPEKRTSSSCGIPACLGSSGIAGA